MGAHRQVDLAQEQTQAADHRDHRRDEGDGHGDREIEADQGAEERPGHHQAHQQGTQHLEEDRGVDELATALEQRELELGRLASGLGESFLHALVDRPASIDDAAESGIHRIDQRCDAGQQEDRCDRELDRVGEVGEMVGHHRDPSPVSPRGHPGTAARPGTAFVRLGHTAAHTSQLRTS